MNVVQNDAVASYIISETLGVNLSPPFVGLCIMNDENTPYGVVVFNDFTGANVEMTGVGRGCWSPRVIRDLARYAFGQLGCRRVTARTAVSNEKAIKALTRLGFKREGIARQWFDGEDAVLFGLLRDEQRILK